MLGCVLFYIRLPAVQKMSKCFYKTLLKSSILLHKFEGGCPATRILGKSRKHHQSFEEVEQQHNYCTWIVPPVFHSNPFLVHWLEPSTKHHTSIWWHHPIQSLLYSLQAKLKSGSSNRVVQPDTCMVWSRQKHHTLHIYILQYKSVCWSNWSFDRNISS